MPPLPIPNGIVRTTYQERLWLDTRIDLYKDQKYRAFEFWKEILYDVFVELEDDYIIKQEKGFAGRERRERGLRISMDTGYGKRPVLIVFGPNMLESNIDMPITRKVTRNLEDLLEKRCERVLNSKDLDFVYGLVINNTRGRMFRFDRERGWVLFSTWFSKGRGENRDGYRDVKDVVWRETFKLLKSDCMSDSETDDRDGDFSSDDDFW